MVQSSKLDLNKAEILEDKLMVLSENLDKARQEKQELLLLTSRQREQINDLETTASIAKTQIELLNTKLLHEAKQRTVFEARVKTLESDAMKTSTASSSVFEEENAQLKQRIIHLESVIDDLKTINAGINAKVAILSEKELLPIKKIEQRSAHHSDVEDPLEASNSSSRKEANLQIQVLQNQKQSLEKENLELHANLEEAMEKIYLLETQSNKNYSLHQEPESYEWGRLEEIMREGGFEFEEEPLRYQSIT